VPADPTTLNNLNPLAVHRFAVEIGESTEFVGVFTECNLPDAEWDVQQLKEGGQNNYVHQLPGQRKPAKITLKHGLTKEKILLDWYAEMMSENIKSVFKTVTIRLMDSEARTVMSWHLHNAYPIKITWPGFKTGDNAVAVQSLELACGRFEFEQNW
jgi:phage tail-like protein